MANVFCLLFCTTIDVYSILAILHGCTASYRTIKVQTNATNNDGAPDPPRGIAPPPGRRRCRRCTARHFWQPRPWSAFSCSTRGPFPSGKSLGRRPTAASFIWERPSLQRMAFALAKAPDRRAGAPLTAASAVRIFRLYPAGHSLREKSLGRRLTAGRSSGSGLPSSEWPLHRQRHNADGTGARHCQPRRRYVFLGSTWVEGGGCSWKNPSDVARRRRC